MAGGPDGPSSLRLLLDEMLSPAVAIALRERGHDVIAVAEDPALRALPDHAVLDVARAQGRAVVTDNVRDYRPLHHRALAPGGGGHAGMVFIAGVRRNRAAVGRIVAALEAQLRAHPGDEDLADRELWLTGL